MSIEKKRCYRCSIEKPLLHFIQRVDDRHYSMCRVCVTEILSSRPRKKERLNHTTTHRTCYLCRRLQPNSDFTQRSNGTFFSACKECNKNVFAQRRRARMAASGGTFTTEEWENKLALYDHCPRCMRPWGEIPLPHGRKTPVTRDHIVPISKGGSNSIENIQPLCYSCNSKKGAGME